MSGDNPLTYALEKCNCSSEIVNLLLDGGADVNLQKDGEGTSPLIIALSYSRNEDILKTLVNRGADVNARSKLGHSSICIALRHGYPIGVIKLLLAAGCCLHNACGYHDSLLDCIADYPLSPIVDGFMKLFIDAGEDLHRINRKGQSVVCVALNVGASVHDIELLLEAGASLNACLQHTSLLHCSVVVSKRIVLKEDVVKFLLNEGANTDIVNESGFTPLQLALQVCMYEVNAIKLLIEVSDVDANVQDTNNNTLLHLAVRNRHCKFGVVKYLIDRGAKLDKVNNFKETPLHLAVDFDSRSSIVSLLLQHGSPINAGNSFLVAPLQSAVFNAKGSNGAVVLRLLLNAGVERCNLYAALKCSLEVYNRKRSPNELECFKMLLKYYVLENGELGIGYMIDGHWNYNTLSNIVIECVEEVREMGLKAIGCGYTLHEFVSQPFLPQKISEDRNPALTDHNLNQLMRVLSNNTLPLFFEVISAKVGRSTLKTYLEELQVYAVRKDPYPLCIENQSFLDYSSVLEIVEFLSQTDIVRLSLAFYSPDDHAV